jgi:transmembrane sensor
VLRGTVEVRAEPRPSPEPPLWISVSGGAIEVVGTRFTIVEAGTRGAVSLHEGALAFHTPDGRTQRLAAGERLAWPVAPVLVAPPTPSPAERATESSPPAAPFTVERATESSRGVKVAPPSPTSRAPEPDTRGPVPDVISRVTELRSRGRYADAAAELERALKTADPSEREVLRWELSSILAFHLRDKARACVAIRAYLREFPNGRSRAEAARAWRMLACETESPR